MVATDHAEASRIGVEVLKSGGNAFDAAVAVGFALAVARPESTGLGGGGFLIAYLAEKNEVQVYDYRETAPAASRADMFDQAVSKQPARAPPSRYAHLAVAVPGQVAGLSAVLQKLGTRSIQESIAPAIELALQGFAVDDHYVEACGTAMKAYKKHPELRASCPYVFETHLRGGDLRKPGDTLQQPRLAKLLTAIAKNGAKTFYEGPVAEAIEEEMRKHGGIITRADLAAYEVEERAPLRTTYRGLEVVAMPSPSSGGTCIIETLNILENFDVPALFQSNEVVARHYMIEAMKHAFADRARWLGDSDHVHVPTDMLVSKDYARRLADRINAASTSPAGNYGTRQLPEDAGTSHFCIVDRWGNCVVSTETINTHFGSLAAVGEWGLILNNEMDDFAAHEGEANVYGLMQSRRNAPGPGKRPLSSMSPTMVFRSGRPILLLGGSGGPRIITSVLNVLIGATDAGKSLKEAMVWPRVHHQWLPDEVFFDRAPDPGLEQGLRKLGHGIADRRLTGVVQSIQRTEAGWVGASDPRKGGRPAGY